MKGNNKRFCGRTKVYVDVGDLLFSFRHGNTATCGHMVYFKVLLSSSIRFVV